MKKSKSKSNIKTNIKSKEHIQVSQDLPTINPHAAGVDIGSRSHYVAAQNRKGEIITKEFGTFSDDLNDLVKWLKNLGCTTVAMESTGTYWIPFYEKLTDNGLEAVLVNASHVKNVPGRKTDVKDCQWIQKLHSIGLLRGAFRPTEDILQMRTILRHRQSLVRHQSPHVLHIQKALTCMNVQLHHAVSDVIGATGMRILHAILEGERDCNKLATLRDPRCQNTEEVIARALNGDYKSDQMFVLKQSVQIYKCYQEHIHECDKELHQILSRFDDKISTERIMQFKEEKSYKKYSTKNKIDFPVAPLLHQKTGINLLEIPSFGNTTILTVISEIGLDVNAWRTAKHFTSWLTLAPRNKISGGKILSSSTCKRKSKLAQVLKFAASNLRTSHSYLGAQYRRLVRLLGEGKAITAMARKLAVIMYNMLKYGQQFVEFGIEKHEKDHRERKIKNLQRNANEVGFKLIPIETMVSV